MPQVNFRQFARKHAMASSSTLQLDGYKIKLVGAPETLTPEGFTELLDEQPEGEGGNDAVLTAKGKRVTLDGSDDKDADAGNDTYIMLATDVREYLILKYEPKSNRTKTEERSNASVPNGSTK